MKIEVGSTWINKNDLDNTVTVGAFAVTGHSDKNGLYMAKVSDFLHHFEPLPDSRYESLSELSEQEFENIINEAFEEGYAQANSELQTKTERERTLQEKAWDNGCDQAIDDLIEAGVIGEEEYLDDDSSDEVCSEYEFGDVGDGEEEYCFSKELDKILNDAFVLEGGVERKHSHYFKDVRHLDYLDIYQVCKLFEVDDPSHCTQHSIKKLLMSGKRGAKDKMKDIIEARDTLNRYLQIEGIE